MTPTNTIPWCAQHRRHGCDCRTRPERRYRVEGCRGCELDGNRGPSHDASWGCESGKHPHCTCDECF